MPGFTHNEATGTATSLKQVQIMLIKHLVPSKTDEARRTTKTTNPELYEPSHDEETSSSGISKRR